MYYNLDIDIFFLSIFVLRTFILILPKISIPTHLKIKKFLIFRKATIMVKTLLLTVLCDFFWYMLNFGTHLQKNRLIQFFFTVNVLGDKFFSADQHNYVFQTKEKTKNSLCIFLLLISLNFNHRKIQTIKFIFTAILKLKQRK